MQMVFEQDAAHLQLYSSSCDYFKFIRWGRRRWSNQRILITFLFVFWQAAQLLIALLTWAQIVQCYLWQQVSLLSQI